MYFISTSSLHRISLKRIYWDFLDGPVVKTPCSQCRGHGFDPSMGIPHAERCGQKRKRKKNLLNRLHNISKKQDVGPLI